MEASSLSKLKWLKSQLSSYQTFMSDFLWISGLIANKFSTPKLNNLKELIVVFSTDKSLCGSFNSRTFKSVVNHCKDNPENVDIFCIWKKAFNYFVDKWFNIVWYQSIQDDVSYDSLDSVINYVSDCMAKWIYWNINVFFNKFVSKTVSKTILLNFNSWLVISDFSDIIDIKLDILYSAMSSDIQYWMDSQELFDSMIKQFVSHALYGMLLNNKMCEISSRLSLVKCPSPVHEVVKWLVSSFNQIRESLITQKVLEIMSSKMRMEEKYRVA